MSVYWYASWATFAFWAISPLWALYRHFASQAMSHRHCLLWQCRYTDMPSLAVSTCCHLGHVSSTLSALTMPVYWYAFFGCAIAGHLLVCKMIRYVNMPKPGYSMKPDMIRDMILVSFEIDVSIYYWARIGDNWKDYRMPWYAGMPK
jgi:hypothetical protein